MNNHFCPNKSTWLFCPQNISLYEEEPGAQNTKHKTQNISVYEEPGARCHRAARPRRPGQVAQRGGQVPLWTQVDRQWGEHVDEDEDGVGVEVDKEAADNNHDAEDDNADYDFGKQEAGIEFAPTFNVEDIDEECEPYCKSRSEGVN